MTDIFTWSTAELEYVLRDEEGNIPEGIFEELEEAVVTVSQGSSKIEKRGDDVEIDMNNATLRIHLNQEDTAKFQGGTKLKPKTADTQVNLYYLNQERNATYENQVNVLRNLHPSRLP